MEKVGRRSETAERRLETGNRKQQSGKKCRQQTGDWKKWKRIDGPGNGNRPVNRSPRFLGRRLGING